MRHASKFKSNLKTKTVSDSYDPTAISIKIKNALNIAIKDHVMLINNYN